MQYERVVSDKGQQQKLAFSAANNIDKVTFSVSLTLYCLKFLANDQLKSLTGLQELPCHHVNRKTDNNVAAFEG